MSDTRTTEEIAAECVGADREWSINQVKLALNLERSRAEKAEKTILEQENRISELEKELESSLDCSKCADLAKLTDKVSELEAELSTCRELSDLRLEGETKQRKEVVKLTALLVQCGEIVNDCKPLFGMIQSFLKETESCLNRVNGLRNGIENTAESTQEKIEKHYKPDGEQKQKKDIISSKHQETLQVLKQELERLSLKLSTGERLLNQTLAHDVRLSLRSDLFTDTTKIILCLMSFNGFVRSVMDCYIEKSNTVLSALKEAMVIK
jgi:chromosome segregation ATPase